MIDTLPWFIEDPTLAKKKMMSPDTVVVLDFETTAISFGSFTIPANDILLACWHIYHKGVLVAKKSKRGNEYAMQELVNDIANADLLIAFNAKFELGWLKRCGLDLRSVLVYDPMVAEWCIQGNRPSGYSLEELGGRYLNEGKSSLVSKYIKLGVPTQEIPSSWLEEYCHQDVDLCYRLYIQQRDVVWEHGLEAVVYMRSLVIPCLADIETQGLQLDATLVNAEYAKQSKILEELGNELDLITGGINLASPKQLGVFLYDQMGFDVPLDARTKKPMQTPSGGRPTSVGVIDLLVPTTDEQVRFLEAYRAFNKASTLMTKNLLFFKKVVDHNDCVFYGQINQCRTGTHRLAGGGVPILFPGDKDYSKIQLQNIPREYKYLFTALNKGWTVTEVDGSQIEFRVGADVGNDKQAEADIVNGEDIHSSTRDVMNAGYIKYGIDKEIDRQGAKSKTFAPLFGSKGTDEAEKEYVAFFRKKYKGIYETQRGWTLTVADQKKLRTPWGLTFYWPRATMYNSGEVSGSTEIFNYPIQNLATGEIIPLSLVMFWHRTKDVVCEIFNTIHDSIIFRSPEELVPQLTSIAKRAMTTDVYQMLELVYGYTFRVPLGFGMKSGKHWGDTKTEWKWDVWPDGNERMQVEHQKKTQYVYDTRDGDTVISYTEVVL